MGKLLVMVVFLWNLFSAFGPTLGNEYRKIILERIENKAFHEEVT